MNKLDKNHAAIKGEAAQREKRTQERHMVELSMFKAVALIINQLLDVDEIAGRAMDEVLQQVNVHSGALYLLDEETGELCLITQRGLRDETIREASHFKLGESVTGRVAQTGKSEMFANFSEYTGLLKSHPEEQRIQSLAVIPLLGSSSVIGTMNLGTTSPQFFDEDGVDLLISLGRLIATGVEKARLYQRTLVSAEQSEVCVEKRTEDITLINELNEAANRGKSLEEIIKLLAEKTRLILRSNAATVYLLSMDGKEMVMQNLNLPAKLVAKIEKLIGREIPKVRITLESGGVYSEILATGESLNSNDPEIIQRMIMEFTEIPDFSKPVQKGIQKLVPQIVKILGIGAVLVIPLISDGKSIGLIDISRDEPFIESDLQRLETLAGQMTVIIERLRAQEALRKERDFADSLVDTAQVIILALDTKGRIVRFNKFMEELSGYALAEVQGKDYFSIFLPERNRTATRAIFQKVLGDIEIKGNINVIVTKEGRERLIEWNDKMLSDADGNAAGVLAVGPDVTERVQAQEKLIRSEELLKATGKTALVGGWGVDIPSMELTWTDEVYRIHEVEPNYDLNVERAISFYAPEHQPIIEKAVQAAIERGESYDLELGFITAKGKRRWVHTIGEARQENGKTTRIFGTIQDITISKENEIKLKEYSERLEQMVSERTQALEKAQEELLRKEKLAILGQLAGSIAHELRNPLGVISNSAYYLGIVLPDSEESVRESLDMISEEVRKSSKIISDLLNFSRGQVSEPQTATISSLVEGVLASQPPPEDIELSIHLLQDLPPIFVDVQQIGEVLINLVTNAYDAMPNGGKLSVQALAEDGIIKLSITDSGCGISSENLEMLFDPLFTTKAKGVGLGLAISKNFAEANGATIEVESVEGEGTRFTIIFPAMSAV